MSHTNAPNNKETSSITRIWRGWTSRENAARFEKTLTEIAIPSIEKERPSGLQSIQLLKREVGDEIEFTTIMLFSSVDDIKAFAGENYERAHIDPAVAPLLLRYDLTVAHHESLFRKSWN